MREIQARPLKFMDYLPQFFRENENFLSEFLKPFEELFEELQVSIEGKEFYTEFFALQDEETICVTPFDLGSWNLTATCFIRSSRTERQTRIKGIELPASQDEFVKLQVEEAFGALLVPGDPLIISDGRGLSDIFDPDKSEFVLNQSTVLPGESKQFLYSPSGSEMQRLKFLASWLVIPLRDDKPIVWNTTFLKNIIPIWKDRYSIKGLEQVFTEWLRGDLDDSPENPRPVIITDLTSKYNCSDTAFCLDQSCPAVLDVDTILGEGPQYFFIIDIVFNPEKKELASQEGFADLFRAVCFLLDKIKPAHTYYQIRIRAHSEGSSVVDPGGTVYWNKLWRYDQKER